MARLQKMRICRNIIFPLMAILLASADADASALSNFILERQGESAIAVDLDTHKKIKNCFNTSTHAICMEAGVYPNIQNNPLARVAVLKSLATSVKYALYSDVLKQVRAQNLNDPAAVTRAWLNGYEKNDSKFLLKGVEFITEEDGNWCGAVAAVGMHGASQELRHTYKDPAFIKSYCATLLPTAQRLMREKNYGKALIILKELHDLKFANIEAYLLATQAFLKNGEAADARKIALEIFHDFKDKLTSGQAEELGDLLVELKCESEAEKSYKLAAERL